MAKRTITPVSNPAQVCRIDFPTVKIAEFGRVDPASGWIKFHCNLPPKGMDELFAAMDWTLPGDKTFEQGLDGNFKGGDGASHFVLTPKLDKGERLKLQSKDGSFDTDAEVDIEFLEINRFKCLRFKIEGRKGKGFRRELRFLATFKCPDGCANLESYMMRTDNARGSLRITYQRESLQTEIPFEPEEQLTLGDAFSDKSSPLN